MFQAKNSPNRLRRISKMMKLAINRAVFVGEMLGKKITEKTRENLSHHDPLLSQHIIVPKGYPDYHNSGIWDIILGTSLYIEPNSKHDKKYFVNFMQKKSNYQTVCSYCRVGPIWVQLIKIPIPLNFPSDMFANTNVNIFLSIYRLTILMFLIQPIFGWLLTNTDIQFADTDVLILAKYIG